jgi:hypothetical protein
MTLQASGPISWSRLNLAYGLSSNASLSISTIRSTTSNVGVSNISMSNFQNAMIPLNSICMNRYLTGVTGGVNDATTANTIFNNSNGTVTYVSSITVPSADSFGNEWTGFLRLPASGTHTFQVATDDGGEFQVNNSVVANHYGQHGADPPGTAATVSLNGGVYPFKFRQQEAGGGELAFISYTPPSGTQTAPSAITNASFMSNVCYLYKPIVKLDANDLFYRQGVSANAQLGTWSNLGTDGTLRHATALSANASTLATLTSDTNGYMVSFDRTKQQYLSLGNIEFDQFQSSDASPIIIKGLTIVIVGRMTTTSVGNYERFFDFGSGAPSGNIIVARNLSKTASLIIATFNGTSSLVQTEWLYAIDGAFHVYTITITNASTVAISVSVDNQSLSYGSASVANNAGSLTNRTTTINYIGRSNWGADSYFTGDIREVQIYREVLNATVLSRLNRYLMYKWGIREFMPPITSGLIGLYTGESYVSGTQWTDLSGLGNHATTLRGTPVTNAFTASSGLVAVSGTTTAGITFPSGIVPTTYTLFHLARYTNASANRRRIFDGVLQNRNWLSGFWNGLSGVAHHLGFLTQTSTDVHGNNWVLSCDQNSLYRSNGVDRTVGSAGSPSFDQITINSGYHVMNYTETSEWACACVIVYNRTLSTNEILQVETFINRRYNVY